MTVTPLARASSSSFLTGATEATQRGRPCSVQDVFMKSMTSSAVVFGSAVTFCKGGISGALMVAHSDARSAACAPVAAAIANSAAAALNFKLFIVCTPDRSLRRAVCGGLHVGLAAHRHDGDAARARIGHYDLHASAFFEQRNVTLLRVA